LFFDLVIVDNTDGADRTGRYGSFGILRDVTLGLFDDLGFIFGSVQFKGFRVDNTTAIAADTGVPVDYYFFGR